jgi:SAM-dependent methyltransferase
MFHDVVELKDFYDTRLGQVARHMVRRRVREVWPDLRRQRVLGIGYATPYLRQFHDEAERVLAFMPGQQGVLHWPPEGPNAVGLVDESALPLGDYTMDRVLLVHSLEHTEQLRPLLAEVWRVLMGDGRLLVVVPNRRSLWSRLERTPMGHGRPFSQGQLDRLLKEMNFVPRGAHHALFVPPTRARTLLGAAPAWERIGQRWFPRLSGVVMIEASKQVYATTRPAQVKRLRPSVVVPFPSAARPTGARRDAE